MDIRKKKRILRPSLSFAKQHLSLKSFVICCSFVLFLLLLSRDFGPGSGSFQPARGIIMNLSVFSSSINNSLLENRTAAHPTIVSSAPNTSINVLEPEFRIENRVLFTDHVLVILSPNGESSRNLLQLGGSGIGRRIDCVYQKLWNQTYSSDLTQPILSVNEYGETGTRWIIRCPYPPENYSAGVGLKAHLDNVAGHDWELSARENQTVLSWDMVAYEAIWDGNDTAVVFVKGFNLRSDRDSDPDPFTCRFELENREEGSSQLTSQAITASQEVIRCPVPQVLKTNLKNNESIKVSVERAGEEIPSVAKLHPLANNNNKGGYKYELCACTMVWNQAAFIREWITYHAWLGVQRWFLYDNNSNDGLKEEIDELNSKNYNVTTHVWPWVKAQEAGFSHCVLRARDECRWVGFFDVDEFYYFPSPRGRNIGLNLGYPGPNSLQAVLKNVSSSSPSVGEIRTDCYSYGPSGLKESPPKGVTIGYTCRIRSPERHKSIVRPDAVGNSLLNQVHHFILKKEYKKKSLLPSIAVINHYKYQVWDIFRAKFHRRVSTYVADWQEKQNEKSRDRTPGLGTEAIEPQDWHLRFCEVWDTKLRDFMLANLADTRTGLLPWERSV